MVKKNGPALMMLPKMSVYLRLALPQQEEKNTKCTAKDAEVIIPSRKATTKNTRIKPVTFRTKVPIYDLGLVLSVSETLEEAYDALPNCFDAKDEVVDDKAAAFFLSNGGIFAIGLARESLTHRYIAHEIHHTSGEIMGHVEADHHEWSDEPVAYLHGWITEWVYGRLRKANLYKLII
jgi:hypothetical protein